MLKINELSYKNDSSIFFYLNLSEVYMDFKKNDECLFIDDDNIKKCIFIGQNDNIFQFKGVDDKHDFYLTQ